MPLPVSRAGRLRQQAATRIPADARGRPDARRTPDPRGRMRCAFRPRPRGLRSIRHGLPVRWPPPCRPPALFHCDDTARAVPRPMSAPGSSAPAQRRRPADAQGRPRDRRGGRAARRRSRESRRAAPCARRCASSTSASAAVMRRRRRRRSSPRCSRICARACNVARLKGGDPFVFGRGGGAGRARAAGFPVEVVNSVTAGIAAPAAIGIPVTQRGARERDLRLSHGAGADEPDWRALAATRMTIVIYMGIRRLDAIATALRDGGLPGETPCAAIEHATRARQRHVLATLDTLVDRVGASGISSPAIVVIGRVAAFADDPASTDRARAAHDARRARHRFSCGRDGRATRCRDPRGADAVPGRRTRARGHARRQGACPRAAHAVRATRLPLVAFDVAQLASRRNWPRAARRPPRSPASASRAWPSRAQLAAPHGRLLGKSIRDGVTVALAGPL